ncbi:MAG: 30S ribosomal protein S16 [Minisyncoccota bacterium]
MLKIRMQRVGRINMPSYRIIVVEHTEGPKTGKFTDIVGTYDPRRKERKLDETKIKYWISVGAQPSDTVHNMFVSAGIIKGKKINVLPKFVEPEKPAEEAAPEAPAAEAPAEEAAPEEAPAAEEPATEPAPEEPKAEEAPAQ